MTDESSEIRQGNADERLLEDSWEIRRRRAGRRELKVEAVAGICFLATALGLLAAAGTAGLDVATAVLLVGLYAAVSRVEFPIGAGYVVPSYLVLVPMLILLPPAIVPLLVAAALVLGAFGQWLCGLARPERMLFSIPDAWHAVGPAAVLAIAGPLGDTTAPLIFVAAFAAACLVDLASATMREAAILGVAPKVQILVLGQVWVVDACLAPVGYLAAKAASEQITDVLLVMPLGALLLFMARDRNARIAQAQFRLEQAFTDPLTSLGNRRLLDGDLREQMDAASAKSPLVLMAFDLNGFKNYNDTFGHAAGDALLARLGGKLTEAISGYGSAYRLGGDEFCVLVKVEAEQLEDRLRTAVTALSEDGDGFKVDASYGVVLLPHEASNPDEALQLADRRMYQCKQSRTGATRDQARDVLMRSIEAREPSLRDHSGDVATLVSRIARRLGLDAEQTDEAVRAAELHDVGKVGIPDAILNKPAALDEGEWEFMRQHTILGERILNAAPALRPVGSLVRSTHERWDGGGYPDGLRGEEIPLGARIVAVCDAYESMVSDRAYRKALGHEYACAELHRESGKQFDPAVVVAFLLEIEKIDSRTGIVSEDTGLPDRMEEVAAHLRELLATA